MKKILVLAAILVSASAFAETKVINITNVHCQDCVATLKQKICVEGKYASCDVVQTDEKNELGRVTIVSKGSEMVDMQAVTTILTDEGYPLAPVVLPKPAVTTSGKHK
jgi:hypothetical protein